MIYGEMHFIVAIQTIFDGIKSIAACGYEFKLTFSIVLWFMFNDASAKKTTLFNYDVSK